MEVFVIRGVKLGFFRMECDFRVEYTENNKNEAIAFARSQVLKGGRLISKSSMGDVVAIKRAKFHSQVFQFFDGDVLPSCIFPELKLSPDWVVFKEGND